jgi:hypothetical protein
MSVMSHDSQSVSGLMWAFKLLPTKHTETSIWHVRLFASTFRDQHMVA